ncbi:MAG: recombinase RecA [Bryobacter sp.]|nr:recombinase RecA [Bryobacter sp.]
MRENFSPPHFTPVATRTLSPLAQIALQIEKAASGAKVTVLGSRVAESVPVIPTGSLQLDHALGCGGFARGRIVEVYGPESSGKTTLALHAIAEVQKQGGLAAFIDVEHALDPTYAQRLGVDLDRLLFTQPDFGEQALEVANAMIATGEIDLVVVDSVAALVPKAELDGDMGDSFVGLHARLMSQAMRKLIAAAAHHNCCLLFINQIREKIGVMFGSPETTTGGRALKFYASQRLEVRRTGQVKEGDEVRGNKVKVKVVKNKLSAPFREVEFEIRFGQGIDRWGEIVDAAAEHGVVTRSGSWFSFAQERLGQGREQAVATLKENRELARIIETALYEKLGLTFEDPGTRRQRLRIKPTSETAAAPSLAASSA